MKIINYKLDACIRYGFYDQLASSDQKLFCSTSSLLSGKGFQANGAYVKLCKAFYWDDNMPYRNLQLVFMNGVIRTTNNN